MSYSDKFSNHICSYSHLRCLFLPGNLHCSQLILIHVYEVDNGAVVYSF